MITEDWIMLAGLACGLLGVIGLLVMAWRAIDENAS